MNERTRLDPKDRKAAILDAAVVVAAQHGHEKVTREAVASQAGCSQALISSYFGTMKAFRRRVLREALKRENLQVVIQCMVANHPEAAKFSPDLKQRASAALLGKS